jgi:uncharacterized protein (DUF2147 family)
VKSQVAISALLSIVATPALAQTDVMGRWATPGVSALVDLTRCADAETLCGTIGWLWDAVDERGLPHLDANNADVALRARPLLGLAILSGLKRRTDGAWSGQIYNPEDGQTYRAVLKRAGADTLNVEGCVLRLCKKQVWRKASAIAEALK